MKRTISILGVAVMAFGLCISAGADTDGGEKGIVGVALVDASGLEYFINTNVTFSITSSASGAASEASYTRAVPASTSLGGTTMSTLEDAFDGYNAVGIEVSGGGRGKGILPAGVVMYNNNGAATLENGGRTVVFNTQSIDGINVSRKVFVPANNTFARWMTLLHNTGEVDVDIAVYTFGNLGSDENTIIHDTSSGDDVVTSEDSWAVSYQDYENNAKGVVNISTDPRLAHIFFDVDDISFIAGDDITQWVTSFELPVGERRIVLNYVSGMPNLPSAEAMARALANPNTAANAKDFMTADERRDVVNAALTTGGGGGGSGGTCFIATAAYGTPMAEEINTLRAVRDTYMLNNAVGAAFVDTYYRFSPPIADFIAQSPALRLIVRVILTPIVLLSKLTLASPLAGALAMLAMGLVSLRLFRKVRKVWAHA